MKRTSGSASRTLFGMLLSVSSAALAKEIPRAGESLFFVDGAGRKWCVTIGSTDVGVDGQPWAWFTVNADPRRIGHVPVADLGRACGS